MTTFVHFSIFHLYALHLTLSHLILLHLTLAMLSLLSLLLIGILGLHCQPVFLPNSQPVRLILFSSLAGGLDNINQPVVESFCADSISVMAVFILWSRTRLNTWHNISGETGEHECCNMSYGFEWFAILDGFLLPNFVCGWEILLYYVR
jgi:hypothetical protein